MIIFKLDIFSNILIIHFLCNELLQKLKTTNIHYLMHFVDQESGCPATVSRMAAASLNVVINKIQFLIGCWNDGPNFLLAVS